MALAQSGCEGLRWHRPDSAMRNFNPPQPILRSPARGITRLAAYAASLPTGLLSNATARYLLQLLAATGYFHVGQRIAPLRPVGNTRTAILAITVSRSSFMSGYFLKMFRVLAGGAHRQIQLGREIYMP